MNLKNWLKKRFQQNVKFNEPMANHTSLKVGGPADIFVAPSKIDDIKELIKKAGENNLPWLVIGGGTNLLVKEKGIHGIVITMANIRQKIQMTATKTNAVDVTALAGTRLSTLCRFAIDNGLSGMNFALGIPGTLGGAICMNAGTKKGTMSDVVTGVNMLDPSGEIKERSKKNLGFSYRKLAINGIDMPIILEGSFTLSKGDSIKIKKEADTILDLRKKNQPTTASAGCFFKNPSPSKPAGKLIDLAGLKGKQIGGARISEKHANFIINTGHATSDDILRLMECVQEKIFKQFNLTLDPEVKIVG